MENMRRADRQINSFEEIIGILDQCEVIFIAMSQDNVPYVIPMNFGYKVEKGKIFLYLHGAKDGKKHNIIAQNPKVSFSGVSDYKVIQKGENHWTCLYKSIIGVGIILEVKNLDEKSKGLETIMEHYVYGRKTAYTPQILEQVKVLRIEVLNITGKQNLKKE